MEAVVARSRLPWPEVIFFFAGGNFPLPKAMEGGPIGFSAAEEPLRSIAPISTSSASGGGQGAVFFGEQCPVMPPNAL